MKTYIPPKPRTQKGNSLVYGCSKLSQILCSSCIRGYSYNKPKIFEFLVQTQQDIDNIPPSLWKKEIFARPCPKKPRHGFIDSRVLSSPAELSVLLKEVLKEDSSGEIALTSFISKAKYNAVYSTSGLLSIGPGHDGATAGKYGFSIPVKPEKLYKLYPSVVFESGLSEKDNIFIESVFTKPSNVISYHEPLHNLGLYITQVRGGPSVKPVTDYVPVKTIVKNIVVPNDDLLVWESQVKKLSPGTVVYGKGHTLASHAAIHCVINKVPFITSFNPKIGQEVRPSLSKEVVLNARQFKLGTTLGLTNIQDMRMMFHLSVSILHNWAYIRNSEHASWLLGLASSYLTRVMCALNFGEYRHYVNKKHTHRSSVYKKIIKSNKIGMYMRQSPKVAATFVDKKKFKTSYGGPRWAASVRSSIAIWNAISMIHQFGLTNTRANRLLSTINKSVNLIHNNGWLFNKISDSSCLTTLEETSGLCAFQLSDVLYSCFKRLKTIKKLRSINFIEFPKVKK